MCLLVLEIAMLVLGLVGLIGGKLTLSKGFPLEGKRARIAGLILALALPLVFGLGFLIGILIGIGALPSSAMGAATVLEWFIVIACLGGAFLYAYLTRPPVVSNLPPTPPPPPEPPSIGPQ